MEFEARAYGKYFLLDKLATGGMAEVFKAKTFGVRGFERLLVIKQILPHLTKDREFVEMFIDEAKISVELSHANIVQVFDLGKIGSNYFIAMEYIDGKDLRAAMKKGLADKKLLSISHACFVMIELLKGLEYAHKKRDAKTNQPLNIIHRDISPQNIMISYDGEVKIVDFGIAKAERRLNETQAGVLKGKFGYMSPEQATGHEVDQRSDIFACGILLFEMLTGRRLFMGENDLETLELIREADVPPINKYNPEVPNELEQIILKALARETSERFPDARTMQLELTKFMFSHNANFSGTDLAFFMKGLFAKEIEEERRRLDQALAMIEEKYRVSERKDPQTMVASTDPEVSFVHPRPFSDRDTDVTEADPGRTPASVKSSGGSDSKKRQFANATTQYQSRPLGSPSDEASGQTAASSSAPRSHPSLRTGPRIENQVESQVYPLTLRERLQPWLIPIALLTGIIILVWVQFFGGEGEKSGDKGASDKKEMVRGGIELITDPAGAEVYIQNKLYGTTPVSLEIEAEKDQTFVFRLPGYEEKSMTLFVAKGTNAPLNITLQKAKQVTVTMRLTSSPAGASIYMNGEDTGKRTPYTFDGLTRDRDVIVRLHKKGYSSEEATIPLNDLLVERNFRLQAQAASLTIQSEPPGATLFMAGRKIGTAPMQISVVMDQTYSVVARLKGYQDRTEEVRINDEDERLRIALKAQIIEFGYISINADPWAMVYLNGELLGHTPILKSKIPIGDHELDFQHTDYGSKKEKIKITKENTQDRPLLIIKDLKK